MFIGFTLALALFVINLKYIVPAHAEQVDVYENQKLVKSVVFKIGVPYYVVDGRTPGVKMDASPFIREGRTFVPVRFLGNALGLDDGRITWDGSTRTATLRGSATLQMTVGRAQVVSNGQAKDIDVAPVIVDPGRTMLPARYVAEGLGYEVGWDEATQTVVCWPKGDPRPDVSAALSYFNQMHQPEKPVEQMTRVERAIKSAAEMGYVLPPGLKEVKGYSPDIYRFELPSRMWLDVRVETGDPEKDRHMGVNLTLVVLLPHSEEAKNDLPPEKWRTIEDFKNQLQQAEDILASKHGRETAKAVVDYARQKTQSTQVLKDKDFPLETGGKINVGSLYAMPYIPITVWR
ncbi:MAG: copper amine oxidase N-terminal domain-containing protein [Firmicutes bacterium]|nr:copper amine oxidase N-terminal domain-containing protein [Bacillota bacterium]